MAKAKILIVEDDWHVAQDTKNILEDLGYVVPAIVSSGEEAIKKAEEFTPDLVIMDIVLKGEMDGIEAADQIHARFNVPIVYLTAHADKGLRDRAKITEPFGYITKPFEVAELHTAIEIALYKNKMEQGLIEREQYFRSLLNNLHEDIIVIDSDYRITDLNYAFLVTTGFKRDEVIGHHCFEVSHGYKEPCDRLGKECKLREVFETGEPCNCWHEHQHKNGSKVCVDILLSPLKSEDGKVTHVIEAVRDVTDIVKADEALRESEEKYRKLAGISPHAIVIHSDGIISDVNPAAVKLFRVSGPEELIGKRYLTLVHPDDRAESERRASRAAEGGLFAPYREHRVITPDGHVIDVESTGTSFRQKDKIFVQSMFTDITERKRAEEELKKKTHDLGERVKELNCLYGISNLVEKIDSSLEEIIQNIVDLIPPAWKYPEITCSRIILEDKEYKTENFKESIWKQSSDIFLHGERSGVLEVYYLEEKPEIDEGPFLKEERDLIDAITERVGRIIERQRAEEEKNKLEDQLRQAQKMEAIGTLAGGIAHDFNNILGAIIGCTELSLLDVPSDNPAIGHMRQVLKAGNRAKNLVKQILAFSRQSEQERKPVKPGTIFKEALKLLRSSLPSTIEIDQYIGTDTGAVLADPTQIHQILMNLCTNAAHAMRERGGILKVNLTDVDISAEDSAKYRDLSPGPYVNLTVTDTGHGMESGVMKRIFDPYFTTKKTGEGTGLGLSVVHGIVKSYGGEIKVHSEPNKGSAFELYLPRIEYPKGLPETEELKALPTGTEQILFVDDEEVLANTGQKMLERLGYKVAARTSSIEALEAFRAQPDKFDLVVTDQTMPNMTGVELTKELRRIRPDIPIVLCTGYSEMIDKEKAKEMGISFVLKPVVMSEIANTVREVLDRKIEN